MLIFGRTGSYCSRSVVAGGQKTVTTYFMSILAEGMNTAEAKLLNVNALAEEQLAYKTIWVGHDVGPSTLSKLKEYLSNGSIIASMDLVGGRKLTAVAHAVVVDGFDAAGDIIIRDPNGGVRYTMVIDEFLHFWDGTCVTKLAP